ncbi:hypothetical protein CPB85DRAFT_1252088 [Mucidula mucida]|nr:hypothetical protein CPB85DRAFT_1252088 [Mucidula mucida]
MPLVVAKENADAGDDDDELTKRHWWWFVVKVGGAGFVTVISFIRLHTVYLATFNNNSKPQSGGGNEIQVASGGNGPCTKTFRRDLDRPMNSPLNRYEALGVKTAPQPCASNSHGASVFLAPVSMISQIVIIEQTTGRTRKPMGFGLPALADDSALGTCVPMFPVVPWVNDSLSPHERSVKIEEQTSFPESNIHPHARERRSTSNPPFCADEASVSRMPASAGPKHRVSRGVGYTYGRGATVHEGVGEHCRVQYEDRSVMAYPVVQAGRHAQVKIDTS